MKCANCGAELPEGSKFCGSCGTAAPVEPVTEPVVEQPVAVDTTVETPESPAAAEAPKKEKGPSKIKLAMAALGAKLKPLAEKAQPLVDKCKPFVQKNKLYLAGAACVLILLLTVLIIVGACNNGNGFTPVEHTISAFVSDGEVMIQYDNKKVIKTGIEAEGIINDQGIGDFFGISLDTLAPQSSIDGSIHAFLTNEGKLVAVKGKKATVVAEDVVQFILSVNGKGVTYVTHSDGEYTLKLQKIGSKKATTVLEDYYFGGEFALSPDGKSVSYFKYNEEGEASLMYFNGSKHTKVTSNNVDLVGMSNKGKQIYVTAYDQEKGETYLYSYNTKGDKKKLGGCGSDEFYFNEDHKQILFFDDDKTYISIKGKEGVKIASGEATIITPNSSVILELGDIMTVPTDNLYNKAYDVYRERQHNAWFIKKNVDRSSKLASNVGYDVTMDESGKYLYFIDKDSELKMLKISHGDRAADKAKLIAEDVDDYVVTSDRKRVYFTAEDSLYSCNGKTGKGKKTISNEEVSGKLVLNQKDICYYIIDGDAYACSNGRRGKLVVADANNLGVTANGIVFVYTDDATFATKTAKKPAKIFSED